MKTRKIAKERITKETSISMVLDMDGQDITIDTGVPFFDHMLHAMAFHGNFGLGIQASGDVDVDPHHLVEDTGIVLGEALKETVSTYGSITRFGHTVIPMDEALSEVTIDAGGRGYAVIQTAFPQEYSGNFHMPLLREFFIALASSGGITLHLECRYGENSHHMAESLFKALGKSLSAAFSLNERDEVLSTKGKI
jgi:imidazoleglycerol-phosphate dehydratase